MRLISDKPDLDDIAWIAQRLCESDRIELALTRDTGNYVSLSLDAFESQFKYVVIDGWQPVMAFGAKPVGDNAIVWGFKTDNGWPVIGMVTKFIRRIMIPALKEEGVSRATCLVHPHNHASQSWLRHLGFAPLATVREFGTRRHEEIKPILFQRDDLR